MKTLTVLCQAGLGDGNESFSCAEGATVGDIVRLKTGSLDDARWLARVNGVQQNFSHIPQDGDRVTITAIKVAGA